MTKVISSWKTVVISRLQSKIRLLFLPLTAGAMISVLTCSAFAQSNGEDERGLGDLFNHTTYIKVPGPLPLARGDFTDIPSKISMRRFAPKPGNQYSQGSCVGWATAYASRTLIEAQQASSSTLPQSKPEIFSPSFIYNQLTTDASCKNGTYIHEALALMKSDGVSPLTDFPYVKNSCVDLPTSQERVRAGQFRIKGYNRLWSDGRNKHIAARRALAAGHPVVVGMAVSETFIYKISTHDGLYRPSHRDSIEALDLEKGYRKEHFFGHAMAVIGYDDAKFGGAFELINSWGTDFGKNGYVWVTYEDFNRFMRSGYEIVPLDPPAPKKTINLGAKLEVVQLDGSALKATFRSGHYVLNKPMPSGSRFRTSIKTDWPTNVYLIGGDKTGDYVELFPRNTAIEPHASKGATVLLPGPTEDYFSRLNETVGTDYYIVLLSQHALDIGVVSHDMKKGSGSPMARLNRVLGDALVKTDDIDFSKTRIGFKAASGEASVVPIILEISHVALNESKGDTIGPAIVLQEPALEAFDAAVDADLPVNVASRFVRLKGTAQDDSPIAQVVVKGARSSQFSSRGPFRAEFELPDGPGPHAIEITAKDDAGNTTQRVFNFVFTP
jgi:hypothetical protein